MKHLFDSANRYIRESDWTDIAALKFCLAALGVILGTHVKEEDKDEVNAGAAVIFLLTWLMLVPRFFRILAEKQE